MAKTNQEIPLGPVSFKEANLNHYSKEEFIKEVADKTQSYKNGKVYRDGNKTEQASNWILILLMFCFALLAFLRAFHRKRLNQLGKTMVNWKLAKQIIRYEKVYTHPVNIGLLFIFFCTAPAFFALAIVKMNLSKLSLISLMVEIIALFGIYGIVKFLIYRLSSWLFNQQDLLQEYSFHVNLISKFLGLGFLLLLSFLAYSTMDVKGLFYSGLGLIGLSLLLQLSRGVVIGLQKIEYMILIILYLCTLEILPWLVIGKSLINHL